MLDKRVLGGILDKALARGGDFADIFIEDRATTLVSCEENRIERIKTGGETGAGVRVVYGDTTAYAYTNKVTEEELLKVADVASRAAKGAKRDVAVDLREVRPTVDLDVKILPDTVAIEDKVAAVETVNRTARAVDGRIKQVMAVYGDVIQDVTIANSLGRLVTDRRVRTRLSINAIAAEGNQIQTGFEALGSNQGFELINQEAAEGLAAVAARRAVTALEAKPAPAGKMTVVMAGEAGGTMVHEACGHG